MSEMQIQNEGGQNAHDYDDGQKELVAQAMDTLKNYMRRLASLAGETNEYADELWERISRSEGVLKELAYYHDYGDFWGKYRVAGYTITDILVWQVDHFKAYLDRHEEVNRWKPERLFLHSLDVMLRMEKDPAPYIEKMTGETGTDFVGKFREF